MSAPYQVWRAKALESDVVCICAAHGVIISPVRYTAKGHGIVYEATISKDAKMKELCEVLLRLYGSLALNPTQHGKIELELGC